jgi:phenylalanyl-tRNA synthetase beta chain
MNVSYDWLHAFVPFDQTAAELRELLTARVATVDELIPLRADLVPIVVALVEWEAPHPDSDHLHITKVNDGSGQLLDVVCGAHNVTAGKLYPFARTGTTMPNGLKIERRKIRGQVSNGMLCSPDELLLGSDHSGIMELSVDVPPGTPFLNAVPVGDTQLVVDVGANRPDLLSHLGIAREIAAATARGLALPQLDGVDAVIPSALIASGVGAAGRVAVRIDEAGLVRRFMGVAIRGVHVGPSPAWLVARLESVGSRSINNVVDASNYVLHELGQPTHAFDLAKLKDSSVVVRRARAGERITTLDGTQRVLGAEMIVIADGERPQAIAGIMGGKDSEVSDATTDIFLEVANFDPGKIRSARRALGMSTDASYRFERGIDIELGPRAIERVAQLIIHLAGGAIDGSPIDLHESLASPVQVPLRTSRVSRVLGESVPHHEITNLLGSIGFEVNGSAEAIEITVPSWRNDVAREVDLIEEVARLRGYDSFPDELRPFRAGTVPDHAQWIASKAVRDRLVAAGLHETRPLPFVQGGDGFVKIANPVAENEAYLRREIIDTLGRRAEHNLAQMEGNLRLFEIGDVFPSRAPGQLPLEELHVGALLMGRRLPAHFSDPKSEEFNAWATYDRHDVKALALEIAQLVYPDASVALGSGAQVGPGLPGTRDSWMGAPEWLVLVNGETRGQIGRVRLDAPVWAKGAWGFELSLGVVDSRDVAAPGAHAYDSSTGSPRPLGETWRGYKPIPAMPAAEFDVALLLPSGVLAEQVEGVIKRVAGDLLERLDLFDEYTGKGVEPGFRSVAWRLTLRHPERTLRDKEIEGRRAAILKALEHELNVRPRTS